MRNAANYGACVPSDIRVDFAMAMERMRRIRARIGRGDSARPSHRSRHRCLLWARQLRQRRGGRRRRHSLRFKKALIATGSRSMLPRFPACPKPAT
jgi:pyruvate/2-oxoglutarate dehydrogenase complex dihydrolipoamide dehydrogenase (E3) component